MTGPFYGQPLIWAPITAAPVTSCSCSLHGLLHGSSAPWRQCAQFAILFGVAHFLEICRVCYRVLTASPPMRLSRPGSTQTDDFGSLLTRC